MTDSRLMEADCTHGNTWYECPECHKEVETESQNQLLGSIFRHMLNQFKTDSTMYVRVTDEEDDSQSITIDAQFDLNPGEAEALRVFLEQHHEQ